MRHVISLSIYLQIYTYDAEQQLTRWLQMHCPAPDQALRDKELLLLLQQLLLNTLNVYLQSLLNIQELTDAGTVAPDFTIVNHTD